MMINKKIDNKNINSKKNELMVIDNNKKIINILSSDLKKRIKKIIKLIYIFLLIGFESLGNMSAVSSVLEENLIKKNKLVNEEDIVDSITIARIGPGATTANAVAYLGCKIYGFWGGIIAGICYTIGPMIIILFIYPLIEKLIAINIFSSALKGGLTCISILLIKSTYTMAKKILENKIHFFIFFISFVLSILFNIKGLIIIFFSIIIGLIFEKNKKFKIEKKY